MSLDVGVIGGGIAGLSALTFVKRSARATGKPPATRLFEGGSRVGGWIKTSKSIVPNTEMTHMYERGPRSVRGAGAGQVTLGLVTALGMSNRVVIGSSTSTKRLLYLKGNVIPVPNTFWEAVRSPFIRYVPNLLLDAVLTRQAPPSSEDESVAQFISRYWGSRLTYEVAAGIVVGIHAGNIDRLSFQSCFPHFYHAVRYRGSFLRGLMLSGPATSHVDAVKAGLHMTPNEQKDYAQLVDKVKAKGPLYSFPGGLQEFLDTLHDHHKKDIEVGSKVVGIAKADNGLEVRLATSDGATRSVHAKQWIAAIPSYELAPAIAEASPTAAEMLKDIEFVDMAVVSLAFEEPKGGNDSWIPPHLRGFGYLAPPPENRKILGVSFDSISFPEFCDRRMLRLGVMIGGDRSINSATTDVAKASHEELKKIALDAVREDLGITVEPLHCDVAVAERAIPQYIVGHSKRLQDLEGVLQRDLPNLQVAGASYHGLGVNDCAFSGMNAALATLAKMKK